MPNSQIMQLLLFSAYQEGVDDVDVGTRALPVGLAGVEEEPLVRVPLLGRDDLFGKVDERFSHVLLRIHF